MSPFWVLIGIWHRTWWFYNLCNTFSCSLKIIQPVEISQRPCYKDDRKALMLPCIIQCGIKIHGSNNECWQMNRCLSAKLNSSASATKMSWMGTKLLKRKQANMHMTHNSVTEYSRKKTGTITMLGMCEHRQNALQCRFHSLDTRCVSSKTLGYNYFDNFTFKTSDR